MDNVDSNIKPVLPDEHDLITTEDDSTSAKRKNDEDDVVPDDCATPDVKSVEMLSSPASSSFVSSEEDVSSLDSMSIDDGELLDLLAETLDVDFDHNLLCFD
jgi:hypothetical protein